MSVEEIKCPHKGLDSGGLCCFLSHAPPCDNCFSNIRILPRSKAGLKERRKKKKKDIKESFERGALGASHSPGLPAMGWCCPCCHHGGNMAGLPGTAEAPHGDVS